jgi:outer membrane protein
VAHALFHFGVYSVLILAGAAPLCAQAPLRPATINAQAAILSTKEGRQATEELSARVSVRKQALEKRQQDLAALQSRLRAGSATMGQAAREKVISDIDANTKSWNHDSQEFNDDVQQEQGKIMNTVGGKLLALVEKYALEHSISFVADVSNPNTPIIWADPALDITNDLIKLYDQTHPVTPATPPAPPASKKQ